MSKREGGPHGDIQTGEGVCLRNELGISWLGLGPNFERSDRAHLASSTLHSFSAVTDVTLMEQRRRNLR
jgi:hypothetical protein